MGGGRIAPRRNRRRTAWIAAAVMLGAGGLSSCAARRPARADHGIARCPAVTAGDLLSADALQCWLDAPHGRWRILSHESHYDVLVVQVEALAVRDAEAIARRFVNGQGRTFSEILVYTNPEPSAAQPRIRRVRWVRGEGFDTLEFGEK
jgi:hypothetical protein